MTVIINGTTGIDTVQDGIVTDAKLNLTANSQEIKDALNAGGTADIYAARAWVNFNGQGTVAIRASGNVSSITDNGTGIYTVNFTNALADANYVVTGGIAYQSSFTTNPAFEVVGTGSPAITTSSFQLYTVIGNQSLTDCSIIYVSVFR